MSMASDLAPAAAGRLAAMSHWERWTECAAEALHREVTREFESLRRSIGQKFRYLEIKAGGRKA